MLARWQPSALARWQPFHPVLREAGRLQNEFNQLFQSFGLNDQSWAPPAVSFPPLNVWEDESNLFVEAELPGMALEDLEIYVTGGNQLTLKGDRKQPEVGNGTWHRQERSFGSFVRSVTLPMHVNAEKVQARFLNGVLTVALPIAEAAKPRKITVNGE